MPQSKGETPIEKNVLVFDEQGNEYEATYPKRAKGLVKNGRARFVGENRICLVRPPDQNLEERAMEENKPLTVNDIFAQITQLQRQLTENSYTSLHRLSDAISSIRDENADSDGDGMEQISEVCDVFKTREITLQEMLALYRRMYDDIQNKTPQKVESDQPGV